MTRALLLVALVLVGCGGAPFVEAGADPADATPDAVTMASVDPIDDAGSMALVEVAPFDAGAEAADVASAPNAAPVREASAPIDAGPEATGPEPAPEAGPPPGSCPDAWSMLAIYCPSGCGPCPAQQAPEYIGRVTLSVCTAGGAGGVTTPAACMACGSYTCACVLAHSVNPCGAGVAATCHESAADGTMPTLICP